MARPKANVKQVFILDDETVKKYYDENIFCMICGFDFQANELVILRGKLEPGNVTHMDCLEDGRNVVR